METVTLIIFDEVQRKRPISWATLRARLRSPQKRRAALFAKRFRALGIGKPPAILWSQINDPLDIPLDDDDEPLA